MHAFVLKSFCIAGYKNNRNNFLSSWQAIFSVIICLKIVNLTLQFKKKMFSYYLCIFDVFFILFYFQFVVFVEWSNISPSLYYILVSSHAYLICRQQITWGVLLLLDSMLLLSSRAQNTQCTLTHFFIYIHVNIFFVSICFYDTSLLKVDIFLTNLYNIQIGSQGFH